MNCNSQAYHLFKETSVKKVEKMMPEPIRVLGTGAVVILGGVVTLNVVSSVAISGFRSIVEGKRKKVALPCLACKGKGFYICKLCKGDATVQWSPLYDPVCINPCVCPTCDGNRVQRCLNCLGQGYS